MENKWLKIWLVFLETGERFAVVSDTEPTAQSIAEDFSKFGVTSVQCTSLSLLDNSEVAMDLHIRQQTQENVVSIGHKLVKVGQGNLEAALFSDSDEKYMASLLEKSEEAGEDA